VLLCCCVVIAEDQRIKAAAESTHRPNPGLLHQSCQPPFVRITQLTRYSLLMKFCNVISLTKPRQHLFRAKALRIQEIYCTQRPTIKITTAHTQMTIAKAESMLLSPYKQRPTRASTLFGSPSRKVPLNGFLNDGIWHCMFCFFAD
jgi:hypothetical protein